MFCFRLLNTINASAMCKIAIKNHYLDVATTHKNVRSYKIVRSMSKERHEKVLDKIVVKGRCNQIHELFYNLSCDRHCLHAWVDD